MDALESTRLDSHNRTNRIELLQNGIGLLNGINIIGAGLAIGNCRIIVPGD
jgi:hypothetical protein